LHRTPSTNNSTIKDFAGQQRPQPGGRFPSDIQIGNRDLPGRLSESSSASGQDIIAAPNGLHNTAGRDAVVSQRSTAQSTPYDQKSLKELEGAMFITQDAAPQRGADTKTSTRYIGSSKAQQFPQSQPLESQRSPAAPKVEPSSPARFFVASLHQDEPETPLESPHEPDNYRVHQSPERPVKTSTQETGLYAFHTAPIEYHSPSIDARSDPVEVGAISSIVNVSELNPWQTTEAEATEQEKNYPPALSRKGTDVSLSHFHVPGEFPAETPGSTVR